MTVPYSTPPSRLLDTFKFAGLSSVHTANDPSCSKNDAQALLLACRTQVIAGDAVL